MDVCKKIFFIGIIMLCSCTKYLPGFDFDLFKGTESYELALAVKRESIDEITQIVKEGKVSVDALDPKFGHSLLMLAVANDLSASVKRLLELGADPNKRSVTNSITTNEIITPVFVACNYIYKKNYCDTTILKTLINYGGKVDDEIEVEFQNAEYKSIATPLIEATKSDCLDIVELLVQSGADINKYNYIEGNGPISSSIIHGNLNVLKYLIIDRNIKIPRYSFVRQAHNEVPREELTVTDFLNEQKYDENSKEFKVRKEIIDYLKKKNLK
ncbi:ankyrin repeat domain-containing protein [Pedobacter sp. FW305-3-2-15-E-R2A2]|jgi:ankyrin repeat protein|uniref:ankyrin repeat domain-containing protein n=1 Tax=Pedobacter sp. FW305-3-2-15-E-R2A2 TaxID=3140251 RepID=UPI003140BE57